MRIGSIIARRLATRRLRAGCADARGATIVEFAMVAAPLIALMLASLATALVFFAQEGLETATETAARAIMTGQAQTGGSGGQMTASEYKTVACSTLPPFLDCSKLMVDVRLAASFATADTSTPTITYDSSGKPTNLSYVPGGPSDIVIVRLMYNWPVPTGPLGFDLSNAGKNNRLLIATSVAQTENYTDNAS